MKTINSYLGHEILPNAEVNKKYLEKIIFKEMIKDFLSKIIDVISKFFTRKNSKSNFKYPDLYSHFDARAGVRYEILKNNVFEWSLSDLFVPFQMIGKKYSQELALEMNDMILKNIGDQNKIRKIFKVMCRVYVSADENAALRYLKIAVNAHNEKLAEIITNVLEKKNSTTIPMIDGYALLKRTNEGKAKESDDFFTKLTINYLLGKSGSLKPDTDDNINVTDSPVSLDGTGKSLSELVGVAEGISNEDLNERGLEAVIEKFKKDNPEITHIPVISTIVEQGVTEPVWIRELVQNSRDALNRNQSTEKDINIRSFLTENDWIVSVKDTAGMDLATLLKVLLVPDTSISAETKSGGFFGIGFFTTFSNADTVVVQSGLNGKVHEITMKVVRNKDTNEITGVQDFVVKEFNDPNNEYKGTIVKVKRSLASMSMEECNFEDMYLQYYAKLMLGGVSDKNILWNGEKINEKMEDLAKSGKVKIRIGRGEDTLNRLTKDE
ncbi:MAG: hypothetical protein HQL29_06735, partial [Candidatus Omnitrophica bacterium]|nr:hypothetical protein [Candidatus Omnitrophota bacterium]